MLYAIGTIIIAAGTYHLFKDRYQKTDNSTEPEIRSDMDFSFSAPNGKKRNDPITPSPIPNIHHDIEKMIEAIEYEGDRPQSAPTQTKNVRFIAIDVETANSQKSSICQIGLALVSIDNTIQVITQLIDPEQHFDGFNVGLHGIDEDTVHNAPDFEDFIEEFQNLLERHPLIQHSNFDKQAFDAACKKAHLPPLNTTWHDSVRIARTAWPELKGNGGHGLASLKKHLDLEFDHHDAGEDAFAAATVVLRAEEVTQTKFPHIKNNAAPPTPKKPFSKGVAQEGIPGGPLNEETVCFTGNCELPRKTAATYAATAGMTVKDGMSKKVTILVVGEHDLNLVGTDGLSSKHRRALELLEQGHAIRIIGELEFLEMIGKP